MNFAPTLPVLILLSSLMLFWDDDLECNHIVVECRKNVSDMSYFVVKQLFGVKCFSVVVGSKRKFPKRSREEYKRLNDILYIYNKKINVPLHDFGSNGSNDKTSCGEHPTDKRIVDCVCPNLLPLNGAAEPKDDDFDEANPRIPTAARPPKVNTFFLAVEIVFLVSPSSLVWSKDCVSFSFFAVNVFMMFLNNENTVHGVMRKERKSSRAGRWNFQGRKKKFQKP